MAISGSVPAQSGVFSLAVQAGSVPNELPMEVNQFQWYRTRAPRIGLAVNQQQDNFPLETGGPIVPTGAFKSGQYGEGDVELIPRIENFLGYLLYGALGKVETHTDQLYNQVLAGSGTTAGVNTHVFTFDPAQEFALPLLALRKRVPGRTAADNYGEVYRDSNIAALRLDIRAAGLLGATVSFRSRKVDFPLAADVSNWTYANTTEDSTSAPLSNNGYVRIGGTKYPITQMSVEFANNLDMSMIVGESHPDLFVSLTRGMTVRVVMKWNSPELYKQILTGSGTGTEWDSLPFIKDTTGNKEAFEAVFNAPANIPGTSAPYSFKMFGSRVVMQVDQGGVELQAGQIVQVPYTITFLEPEAGQEYVKFVLENGSTYAIPEEIALAAGDTVNYSVAGSAVAVAPTSTLTSTPTDFNGGLVTADVVFGAQTGDVLAVGNLGTITVAAGTVSNSASAIGTVTGGSAGAQLRVALNTVDATKAAVEALAEAITFANAAATVGTYRIVRITVWNDNGAVSYKDIELTVTA